MLSLLTIHRIPHEAKGIKIKLCASGVFKDFSMAGIYDIGLNGRQSCHDASSQIDTSAQISRAFLQTSCT